MEVQNQPQVYSRVNFGRKNAESTAITVRNSDLDKIKPKNELTSDIVDIEDAEIIDDAEFEEVFDKEAVERERDKKLEIIKQQQQQLEEAAAQIEETGVIGSEKAGKGLRLVSTVLGLAATFVVAKGSSKIAIETLKSVAKADTVKAGLTALSGLREPARELMQGAKAVKDTVMNNPELRTKITELGETQIGKTIKTVLENKKVAAVLEPIKNTIASVKDIKINGKSIQSGIENTMATVTTGSVLVDDLTGRNNKKSNVEIATGV